MKIELVAPSSGKRINANETIELQVRVTDADGTPASGAELTWLTSGRRSKLKKRNTTTDRWGQASNRLYAKGKAGEGEAPIGITVQTPDGETHVLGMLHDSTIPGAAEGASLFFPRRDPLAPGGTPGQPAIDALAASGTLSIVYPPSSLLLPIKSPVEVWAYYSNNGAGLGNQPVTFTPGDNTSVQSADAQTDADGFAHAVVTLSTNPVTATFDGSVTVTPTNDRQASVNWPLHADGFKAGGPGDFWFSLMPARNPPNGQVYANLWNGFMAAHVGPLSGPFFGYSPVTFTLADSSGSSFFKQQLLADYEGRAWNLLKAAPSGTTLPTPTASAPNAIAGTVDSRAYTRQIAIVDYPQGYGTGSIDVGPEQDHGLGVLPLDTPITFTAIFRKQDKSPWANQPVQWDIYADLNFANVAYQRVTTTNSDGVASNIFQVTARRFGSAPLAITATGYEGVPQTVNQIVQGAWTGQFYDVNDPPFSHEQVDVTPPSDELTVGTGYTFEAQVLTGFDPITEEAHTPAPGQTVHWYADDVNKPYIVFSLPGGPAGQVPGERFPTVTGADGKTSVQVLMLDAAPAPLSPTIYAETPCLDGNSYTGSSEVTFGESQACTIDIQGPTSVPLYSSQTLTAQIQGQSCGISAIDWVVDQGSDQDHLFMLIPPRSNVVNGSTTTQIYGLGATADVSVTVYARPAEPVEGVEPASHVMQFTQAQVPPGGVISVGSLDGDPLSTEPVYHLFRAFASKYDGTRYAPTIAWGTVDSPSSVTWLTTDPTPTDANGIATNGIMCQTAGDVTVTAGGNQVTVTFQDDADLPGQGTMNVRSQDGTKGLSLGGKHLFYADYTRPGGVTDGTVVRWQAFPADRLTFDSPTSTTTGGTATNNVTASGANEIDLAFIHVTSFNQTTGAYDHHELEVSFEQDPNIINIESEEKQPLPLYIAHTLDGTYTGPKQVSQVMWSVDPDDNPDYTVSFEPKTSDMTGNQGALTTTTQMTVFGPNEDVAIRVYAYSTDPDNFVTGITDPPLEFSHAAVLPQTRQLDLDSLDGNPLKTGEWHVVQATYVQAGGIPVQIAPLTWHPPIGVKLAADSGQTDQDGIMTNAVQAPFDVPNVTVTVSADNTNDTADLKLTFQSTDFTLPDQGAMTFTPPSPASGAILSIGTTYTLAVTYLDSKQQAVQDADVMWMGFPSDRLIFGDGSPGSNVSTTNSSGVATITVAASNGPFISTAVFATTAYNDAIGAYDHSEPALTVSFKKAQATTGVVGIEIDKPWAKNPKYGHGIVWTDPSIAIKCQLQVLGASGSQTVLLPTDQEQPDRRTVEMVDATGKALVRDSLTGYYQLTTNGSDPTTFLVGSPNPTRLTIGTQWQGKPQPASTMLTLATNVKTAGDTMPVPTIQELQGKVLPIPGGCPAPTFKVNIPKASGVQDGDYVALLLNNRLVYHGLAAPALLQSQGVDVAYAALNLSGTNNLVYVAFETADDIWGKSLPCSFTVDTTKGQPQTGPCPTVSRDSSLKPAQVDASSPIGASDIVPSLDIYIAPYSGMDANDVITAFFYLQGTDVITQETGGGNVTVYNIVPVKNPNPVVVGETVKLSLPQWAAAGYANVSTSGQLQVDYQVVGKTTRWSQTLPQALTLNTTIPFKSS